uniref:tRNA (adenosine(37)-N6)-threonylcarbamoyltransferase complex dimerization subunit type 1 TsaB n=1 Tax=Tepidiforma sp. TaxID=2682230 RepID=UPI002ADDFDDB
MSTILVIDTASDWFAVGLDGEGRRELVVAEEGRTHTTGLLAAIEGLLGVERPGGVIVLSGPGSYAGLRVGIATAQGISLATGAPLFGVRTFEAIALAAGGEGEVLAIHPA